MKIILIVEDKPEERAKAKEIVLAAGYKVVMGSTLQDALRLWGKLKEKIAGILTDLHFPENDHDPNSNSNGLVVVTEALVAKKPIVICTDINHHYCDHLKIATRNLEQLTGQRIPFTMDRKDWQEAFEELQNLIGGEK